MRPTTIEQRQLLYLQARRVIARNYRRPLRLQDVARALASSPRQVKRAYAQCGQITFREDLHARRLSVAARLLIERPAIPIRDVARIVGFSQPSHFAKAFRGRYGITPLRFRDEARAYVRHARVPPRRSLALSHADASSWKPAVSAAELDRCVEVHQRVDRDRARQAQAHQGPIARRGLRGDTAAVLFGDLAYDRQAET
jgi:AraC family transcriptional regulator of adaptative response / methylphosphotriester-DNA alkyltransferase methyltransferase